MRKKHVWGLVILSTLIWYKAFAIEGQEIPVIRVVCDDAYPPYCFRDNIGAIQGIIPDQWSAWSDVTGIKVVFDGMDWNQAFTEIDQGKADVLDSVFKTAERQKKYDFLEPYATISNSVYFNRDMSGIAKVEDLQNFRIAVKEDDAAIEILKGKGLTDLVYFPSYEAIIRGVVNGDVYVFCMDDPPANYYLYKYRLEKIIRRGFSLYSGQFHRIVPKNRQPLPDGRDLYQVVQEGFKAIPSTVYEDIEKRWKGLEVSSSKEYLVLIFWGIIITCTVVFVLLLFSFILRREVNRRTKELMLANRQRLEQMIQEKETLLKELNHRVKNNLQLIQSLLRLESTTCKDVDTLAETMENKIDSIATVHQMLYESESQGQVNLALYAQQIVNLLINVKDSSSKVTVHFYTKSVMIDVDRAIIFGLLLNELTINAIKYGLSKEAPAKLTLRLFEENGMLHFELEDNGPGLPENFSPENSQGLGIQLAIALSEQLHGNLRWENVHIRDQNGARFILDFPLHSVSY